MALPVMRERERKLALGTKLGGGGTGVVMDYFRNREAGSLANKQTRVLQQRCTCDLIDGGSYKSRSSRSV